MIGGFSVGARQRRVARAVTPPYLAPDISSSREEGSVEAGVPHVRDFSGLRPSK